MQILMFKAIEKHVVNATKLLKKLRYPVELFFSDENYFYQDQ